MVLEIFAILLDANEESDDVIGGGSSKPVQHSVKNSPLQKRESTGASILY